MKFLGKMCFEIIIIKVAENQDFTLSLKFEFFEELQGVSLTRQAY